jgi:hypothetical protein
MAELGRRYLANLERQSRKKATTTAVESILRVWLEPFFAERDLRQITAQDVQDSMTMMEKGERPGPKAKGDRRYGRPVGAKSVRNYIGYLLRQVISCSTGLASRASAEARPGRVRGVAQSPWACGRLPPLRMRRLQASGITSGRCGSDVARLPSWVLASVIADRPLVGQTLRSGIAWLRFGGGRVPRSRGVGRHAAPADARPDRIQRRTVSGFLPIGGFSDG